jgi:hypothetical protein
MSGSRYRGTLTYNFSKTDSPNTDSPFTASPFLRIAVSLHFNFFTL